MSFPGFSPRAFAFLADLAANNDKAWFDAHRDAFDAELMDPARLFCMALGERVEARFPGLVVDPRVNGTIRRIRRDVRFSPDKRPYKDHLDFWFRHGRPGCGGGDTGLFVRLKAGSVGVGLGTHMFDPPGLEAYREAVLDPKTGPRLEKIARELRRRPGFVFGEPHRKRPPRGWPADHPRAAWLLYEGLFVYEEAAQVSEATRPAFVEWCAERLLAMAPLHDWLSAVFDRPRAAAPPRAQRR